MKTSDIADRDFLVIVARFNEGDYPDVEFISKPFRVQGEGGWAFSWDVAGILGIPERLAESKARSLIRRGLMTGCDEMHGCRGDYTVTSAGLELLADTPPAPPLAPHESP